MSGADLSDGGWHHLVIALSGTEAKMYVDGVAEEVSALTGYNSTSTSVISVAVPTGSDKYFEGSMDELRFYKRALSHEEVIEIGEATTFKSFKTTVFGNEIDGVIDSINHTVSVVVPYDGTSATNSYQLHTGASVGTIDPLNTSSLPKSITITDRDSDEQIWTINAPDYESDIVSFSISGQLLTSEIDAANHTVSLYMPYDTDLSSLTPTIAVSPDAVISPVSGGVQDFSDEFIYTVTALDGEVQSWSVSVTEHDGTVTSYELDGDGTDASIYQNDGTLAGTPAYTSDRIGTTTSALSFDGTDDYISAGLMPELAASLNAFTVNFWMRTDNTTEIDRIFGTNSTGNSQYLFATLNYDGTNTVAGTIQLALRDLDGNTSFISVNDAMLVDGDWHMLTLIVNNAANNDIDIYVDGVENTSETVSGIGASNFGSFDNDFLIGALNAQGTPSDFFTGDLD
ncbi:MAG: LamG-like jellyroll fold domain-containing protein, partial [Marinoscillum sp.]